MNAEIGRTTPHGIALPDDPTSTAALLETLAAGEAAARGRYDTILVAAARMIRAFERIRRSPDGDGF